MNDNLLLQTSFGLREVENIYFNEYVVYLCGILLWKWMSSIV